MQALQMMFSWIKYYPNDLTLHRDLAMLYRSLSQIYQKPVVQQEGEQGNLSLAFLQQQYEKSDIQEKKQKAAYLAIQELRVIIHYVPHDPWALLQIAEIYRELEIKEEERKAYEELLLADPHNGEVYYRLGKLYFELGKMAEGLHLYQELQNRRDPKASHLIELYGIYTSETN